MKFMSRTVETAGDVEEWRAAIRDQRARQIINSGKEEIPRNALRFDRYWIEDTRSGRFFRVWRGDPFYAGHAPAFYVTESGEPVILEQADPASREELAERRAARDARRAAREAEARQRRDEARRLAST